MYFTSNGKCYKRMFLYEPNLYYKEYGNTCYKDLHTLVSWVVFSFLCVLQSDFSTALFDHHSMLFVQQFFVF